MVLLVSFIQEPRAALQENGRKPGRARGRAPGAGRRVWGALGDEPLVGTHRGAAPAHDPEFPCKQGSGTRWFVGVFSYSSPNFRTEIEFLSVSKLFAFPVPQWS